jgi:hypothetical protein
VSMCSNSIIIDHSRSLPSIVNKHATARLLVSLIHIFHLLYVELIILTCVFRSSVSTTAFYFTFTSSHNLSKCGHVALLIVKQRKKNAVPGKCQFFQKWFL